MDKEHVSRLKARESLLDRYHLVRNMIYKYNALQLLIIRESKIIETGEYVIAALDVSQLDLTKENIFEEYKNSNVYQTFHIHELALEYEWKEYEPIKSAHDLLEEAQLLYFSNYGDLVS